MISLAEIIDNLHKIIETKKPSKTKLLSSFQSKIFTDESISDEFSNEILTEPAYDLDFYEPNDEARKENYSYCGSENLAQLVTSALKTLIRYKVKNKH